MEVCYTSGLHLELHSRSLLAAQSPTTVEEGTEVPPAGSPLPVTA